MKCCPLRTLSLALAMLAAWPTVANADPSPPAASAPDPFAMAVHNHSTSPFFVLVTIVDDRTRTARKVCTEAPFLVGAMMTEWNLSYENNGWLRAEQRIIAKPTRTYHLSNPKALANVAPRYTEAQLTMVRERLQGYSREQLIRLFSTDRSNDAYIKRGEDFDAFQYAAAFVLEEYGLSVRMADITGHIFALTTEEVLRRQREDFVRAEEICENRRISLDMAKELPGYASIAGAFSFTNAISGAIGDYDNVLCCDLTSLRRTLLDEATWYDPIVGNAPRYDWLVFLKRYRRAAELASQVRWLRRWKEQSTGKISFYCDGANSLEKDDLLAIRSAWRRAGLPGSPECEISLHRKDVYLGDIYLSARSKKSLIYNFRDSDEAAPFRDGLMALRPAIRRRIGVTFRRIAGAADYYVAIPRRPGR